MIFFLGILVFSLLLFTYYGVNRDLMHPSVLIVGATFLCVLSAMYNIGLWNINYHFNTVVLLVGGLLCISLAGILCARTKTKKKKFIHLNTIIDDENLIIDINRSTFYIVIVFNLFVMAWYYYIIIKTTGGGAITEMLASFRMIHSYGTSSDNAVVMPALLNQCIKMNKVLAYIFVMVFLNNYMAYKQKDWKYLLPPVLFGLQTILGSDRIYIVILAGASVVMAYIMWHRKNGWNRNVSGKYIRIAVKALTVVLILFFFTRNFVGHSSNVITSPIEYITQYTGGSIQLLDMFVQDPQIEADTGWGEETFSSVYKTVIQMKGGIAPKRHMEFRRSNGVMIGNIYTAVRKYYHDFGTSGVMVLCTIFGLFFGIVYRQLQEEKIHTIVSYRLCFYCFIVHCAFYFPLDDLFFSGVISINYLSMFLYMWIAYHILIKKPIRFSIK